MTWIGRHVTMTAHAGKGEELAARLHAIAEGMIGTKGCGLYLVERPEGEPDTVLVTEMWRSREAIDAALEGADRDEMAAVKALVADVERRETDVLGGVGLGNTEAEPGGKGWTKTHLMDVPDQAAQFGIGDHLESRFAREALGARATGLGLERIKPNCRIPFGHCHDAAEEVYVVVRGSGRANLDGEVVDLAEHDALRVAPHVMRNFEAGDDGLELLAVGPFHPGDGEITPGWWGG
jgi:quinol monooxygenase YgiN/mannose-6-phosphate isomerase-like protein (cupin superfamily)